MVMQPIDSIFYIIVLIMSVVVHEFAHGYVAYMYGDQTAQLQGRLTLNPIKHLDLFGSIILPLILVVTGAGFVLGWARPVPYNPNNLNNGRKGIILVSIAGIVANLFLATFFGLLIHLAPTFGFPAFNSVAIQPIYKILTSIVLVNIVLAIFNLIPIPPLDGSKVLFELLPVRFNKIQAFLEQWGMFVLIFFIIFLWQYLSPVIFWLFSVLTGIH